MWKTSCGLPCGRLAADFPTLRRTRGGHEASHVGQRSGWARAAHVRERKREREREKERERKRERERGERERDRREAGGW